MMDKGLPKVKKQYMDGKKWTSVPALKGLGLVSKTAREHTHACIHRKAQRSKTVE